MRMKRRIYMIKEYEDAWALGIQYNEAVSAYDSEPSEDNYLAMAELKERLEHAILEEESEEYV
jgi:hypothetical protein